MTIIDENLTVGEIVKNQPARSYVFEQLGIDYCCGGKIPLAEACTQKGIEISNVLELLKAQDAETDIKTGELVDADSMGLTELVDHIEQTHHVYLRRELPRLDQMTDKVHRVHGEKDPRLAKVRQAFTKLQAELFNHMMKEERILFPLIRQIDHANQLPAFHCGSIANPIRQMEAEHDHAGDALAIMYDSTDGYQPPEWACNTYLAMLDALAALERDLHQHIHKENNVLFPKALERETQLATAKYD